jgi:hypothetical protein
MWRPHGRTHSQQGLLESRFTWMFPEGILADWMPAIHAGMTMICL